ncbi:nitroreductase family protein [uncultured Sneathia sp.]|uniref:nitroreductase family protein n=1 Tax=uncultured Sneathia sp. TaxID=278067 RepID=UPI00259537B3|nr:nitroreductase family protein [uncultured Sneathia sp.]
MDLIEAIKNRKSIRKFTDESIKKEDLEEIIEVARRAPSSVNGQQISLVYTTDKNIIEKIAHLSGGQAQIRDCSCFITLIGDYYRDKVYLESVGKELTDDIQRLREVVMVDAGIMALTINYVAMAKGYGCTIIGGVKENPEQIAELLNLPKNTIVALGITIGVPTKESLEGTLKPRIKKEAFAMEDKYNKEVQVNAVKDYEKVLDKWFKDINVEQPLFGDVISRFYSK